MEKEWKALDKTDISLSMLEFVARHDLDPNSVIIRIGKREYYNFLPPGGVKYIVVEEIDGKKYVTHGQEHLPQMLELAKGIKNS